RREKALEAGVRSLRLHICEGAGGPETPGAIHVGGSAEAKVRLVVRGHKADVRAPALGHGDLAGAAARGSAAARMARARRGPRSAAAAAAGLAAAAGHEHGQHDGRETSLEERIQSHVRPPTKGARSPDTLFGCTKRGALMTRLD